ncbi:hypothetical protein ScPMuIL_015034 [Solemya velum]
MKSDILVDTRCRSDGRQCLQRRRSSKSSQQENIEFDPDLALAIQESLKLAKQTGADNTKEPTVKIETILNLEHKEITSEHKSLGHLDMESKLETRQLKDLLLLHIDLIQHQQEQLIQKDREIGTLHKEKEALKCRLERMERRMSLVKHKEGTTLPPSKLSPRQDHTHSPSSVRSSSAKNTPTANADRGVKRKSNVEPQNLIKKFASVSPRVLPERSWLKSPQHTLLHRPREQLIVSDVTRPNIKDQLKELKVNIQTDNEPVLRTDKHYYVSELSVSPRLSPEKIKPLVEPVVEADPLSEVEVPGWRIKTTTRYFNMEGTENLDDDLFLKRHQKPELEERRRKRWDLQSMRERKQIEKLKEKELYESPKHRATIESFHSSLEDVDYIEVCTKLPVMAFGTAIPHLKQIDFQLPWEPHSKPTNRQTRSRHK